MKKTGTIFDALDDEPKTGKEGFIRAASNAPEPKDDSFLSSVGDYAKTIFKGAVEGVSRLGAMMGPTFDLPKFEEGKFVPEKTKEEQLEQQTETLNELLPTDEGFVQSSLRRGLKEAPSMAAFPGSAASLPRSILAGFLGEGAKELGAPEWAQSAAELTAYIGPDITKKLLSQGKNKEIVEFGKKMGMTDEQITPLIQSEFKQKWLSKLAPKRGSTQKTLADTKQSLSNVYSSIQNSPSAKSELPNIAKEKLFNKFLPIIEDMPANVRDVIKQDAKDLVSKPITGESLINFYKDVNHNLSGNSKQLANLKQPIREALHSISPELGKDFEMMNTLYSKYYPIAERLKPNLVSDLVSAAEAIGLLGSFTLGYTPALTGFLTEKAAKKLTQQMLINPRLQQLSQKMVNAMNENKFGVVHKLAKSFSSQIKDEVPEAAKILETISEDEIKKFFKTHHEKEE